MQCLQQDFYRTSNILCSLEKKGEKKAIPVSVLARVSSAL